MSDVAPRSMVDRMIGAAFLDVATYEEVEHDTDATAQAAMVVTLTAVAAAIGEFSLGPISMLSQAAAELFGWLVWAGITYVIGDKVFGGTATWGELLRTLGFAKAPGVLAVLAIVPLLGGLAYMLLIPWLIAAGVVAVRQALDFSTGKAVLTVILGILPYLIVRWMLF